MTSKAIIAGAAMAGLFTGAATRVHAVTVTDTSKAGTSLQTMADEGDKDKSDKHSCKGKNDCKGQGGCKG